MILIEFKTHLYAFGVFHYICYGPVAFNLKYGIDRLTDPDFFSFYN